MKPRYRLYVDESGDSGTGLKSLKQDPYLTLIGVAFEFQYYRDIFQPQLEALKRDHLPYDPDDPPVLHKKDIVDKQGAFWVLRDPSKQDCFDRDLLSLIREADFCLFCVIVDKKANIEKYGQQCPEQYGYAMAGLLARYCGWLNCVVHGVGDVMAEARYKKADRNLQEVFEHIYQYGTRHYPGPNPVPEQIFQATLTTKNLKLKEKNRNIAGLQLADLLTYCCKADVLREYGLSAPRLGPFSDKICRAIQPKYNRHYTSGITRGYGKIFIAPK